MKQAFDAILIKDATMDVFYVHIPFNVEEVFGKKRLPINAWFDGHLYKGTLARYNSLDWNLIVNKQIRAKLNKEAGEYVQVVIEEDMAPREIETPEILLNIFKENKEAEASFNKMSFTHKKEIVLYILEAKKEETKMRRVEKSIRYLQDKFTNPKAKFIF